MDSHSGSEEAWSVATLELVQGRPKASRGHHVDHSLERGDTGLAWPPPEVCFPNPTFQAVLPLHSTPQRQVWAQI